MAHHQALSPTLALVLNRHPDLEKEITCSKPYVQLTRKHISRSSGHKTSCPVHHDGFPPTALTNRLTAETLSFPNAPTQGDLYGFPDKIDDVPASSTPDPLSPNSGASSCVSSPDVPLTQRLFTIRLHALLQALVDRNCEESSEGSVSQYNASSFDNEEKWIALSRGDHGSDCTIRQASESGSLDNNSFDSPYGVSSSTSSMDSLGVWALSPDERAEIYCEYSKTTLTVQNKRKHDDSHESFDDDTGRRSPAAQRLIGATARKKAKLKARISTSSSLSYQTTRTASSRKLSSLTSGSPTSVNSTSENIDIYRCFLHPIVHPPTEPQMPKSKHEAAESRIQVLLERERSYRILDGLPPGPFAPADFASDDNEDVFGIEADLREEIVQWILDILPPRSLRHSDLYRHLKYSEETRFHAMYLFTRYLLRVGGCSGQRCERETADMKAARQELTWDIAFSCLAISIKFYHDFLYPLFPIYTKDFLVISPQLLGDDEFEYLQREILGAFNYEIHGVTPHAFFEELWGALPCLQDILDLERPRQIVRNEMWAELQRASLQWDVMRFPISLLTAAALIEGIVLALLDQYQQEDEPNHSGSNQSVTEAEDLDMEEINLIKACNDVKPICCDIAVILGFSVVDLQACRRWMTFI